MAPASTSAPPIMAARGRSLAVLGSSWLEEVLGEVAGDAVFGTACAISTGGCEGRAGAAGAGVSIGFASATGTGATAAARGWTGSGAAEMDDAMGCALPYTNSSPQFSPAGNHSLIAWGELWA